MHLKPADKEEREKVLQKTRQRRGKRQPISSYTGPRCDENTRWRALLQAVVLHRFEPTLEIQGCRKLEAWIQEIMLLRGVVVPGFD